MQDSNSPSLGFAHHPKRPGYLVPTIIGLVVGLGLFVGVMTWYFWMVNQPVPPLPGTPLGQNSGTVPKPGEDDNLLLDATVVDIIPLSELHLKIVNGIAESVETPADSGLTAKLDGNRVTVNASKTAKAGTHQIKVKGPKGKETTLTVNVKT